MTTTGRPSSTNARPVIHRSPLPDVEIPEVLISELVLRRVADLADKPALIDGPTGRTLTYGDLDRSIRSLAGGLANQGFAPGDVVAIMAPNVPEYAVAFHGVAYAGGVVTTVNPSYTEREVRYQLEDAKPRMMVTVAPLLDTARSAAAGTPVEMIYVLDQADDAPALAELFGDARPEPVRVPLDAPVALPYSSGTTGISKGVVLTHRNLVANAMQTLDPVGIREDETIIAVLPFFHIYGMQIIMNVSLIAGATIVTMPRFDLEQFLQLHQDHRITRSYVAPPIVVALAKHPLVDNFDLSALEQVFSGAAPLSAELALETGARLGCEVVQGYGMTELSPCSHLTPKGAGKPGSVGVTAPNTETMIVDPASGDALGPGIDGEVWVRGPQVMAGYLNNAPATANTIDEDGWLRTGDIGHIDDDGHLYVVDRLKELIKYKGFQVAPAELEAILLTHPAVADAAVIGVPDNEAGEIPVGFVVLKDGQTASEDNVLEFVASEVAQFKQLRRITFIEVVPKSPSGKILRRLLPRDVAAD
ncbi:MAG: 4-coumarate--CoA ligase family protein [Acidimicrobiia bacterium]